MAGACRFATATSAGSAISPDDRILAVASNTQGVELWDLETRELRKALPGRQGTIQALAFAPRRPDAGHRRRPRPHPPLGPGHGRRADQLRRRLAGRPRPGLLAGRPGDWPRPGPATGASSSGTRPQRHRSVPFRAESEVQSVAFSRDGGSPRRRRPRRSRDALGRAFLRAPGDAAGPPGHRLVVGVQPRRPHPRHRRAKIGWANCGTLAACRTPGPDAVLRTVPHFFSPQVLFVAVLLALNAEKAGRAAVRFFVRAANILAGRVGRVGEGGASVRPPLTASAARWIQRSWERAVH